jgi:hypothetical protein
LSGGNASGDLLLLSEMGLDELACAVLRTSKFSTDREWTLDQAARGLGPGLDVLEPGREFALDPAVDTTLDPGLEYVVEPGLEPDLEPAGEPPLELGTLGPSTLEGLNLLRPLMFLCSLLKSPDTRT